MRNKNCIIVTFKNGPEKIACKHSSDYASKIVRRFTNTEIVHLDYYDVLSFAQILSFDKNSARLLLLTHGGWGENGVLQTILTNYGYTHTHSDLHTCSYLGNKHTAKLCYQALKIPTPEWVYSGVYYGITKQIEPKNDYVRKPLYGGSKIGITRVKRAGSKVDCLYERLIEGNVECSVYVMNINGKAVVFPPIERRRDIERIGKLSKPESYTIKTMIANKIETYSKKIYDDLHCKGITKTDFLIDKEQNVFAIETDLIPGIWEGGGLMYAAKNYGLSPTNMFKNLLYQK